MNDSYFDITTVKASTIGPCAVSLELPPLVRFGVFFYFLFFYVSRRGLSSSPSAMFFAPFSRAGGFRRHSTWADCWSFYGNALIDSFLGSPPAPILSSNTTHPTGFYPRTMFVCFIIPVSMTQTLCSGMILIVLYSTWEHRPNVLFSFSSFSAHVSTLCRFTNVVQLRVAGAKSSDGLIYRI